MLWKIHLSEKALTRSEWESLNSIKPKELTVGTSPMSKRHLNVKHNSTETNLSDCDLKTYELVPEFIWYYFCTSIFKYSVLQSKG